MRYYNYFKNALKVLKKCLRNAYISLVNLPSGDWSQWREEEKEETRKTTGGEGAGNYFYPILHNTNLQTIPA
jgi:hypothetical protein